MIQTLPTPIAAYLAADRAKDADGVAQAFAIDAHVRDERHDYHGRDAIRAWKVSSQAKYQYTVEPLTFTQEGEGGILHARLSGTFPGSPVEVDYRFTLADNVITTLEIL